MTGEFLSRLKGAVKRTVAKNRWVPVFWSKTENWGDALNPWLVSRISGIQARFEHARFADKFFCVGSILHQVDAWSTVWGSGLISPTHLPAVAPAGIVAVRGPLTRNILLQQNIDCPQVYGDPALLLPKYLPQAEQKIHDIGVVPHMVDKNHPWIQVCREAGCKVIDIEAPTEDFVQELTQCKAILSSSLHGLICADAYGIASQHICLTDKVTGGEFKFNDYYGSISHDPKPCLHPSAADSPNTIAGFCTTKTLDLDLELLLSRCPFLA